MYLSTLAGEMVLASLDFAGDVVGDGREGGARGKRDAGILAAQVPVVALSKSPTSRGTKSARTAM